MLHNDTKVLYSHFHRKADQLFESRCQIGKTESSFSCFFEAVVNARHRCYDFREALFQRNTFNGFMMQTCDRFLKLSRPF